jgi:hypothetical protein
MEKSAYTLAPAALPPLKILRNSLSRRLGKFQRLFGKEKFCSLAGYPTTIPHFFSQ